MKNRTLNLFGDKFQSQIRFISGVETNAIIEFKFIDPLCFKADESTNEQKKFFFLKKKLLEMQKPCALMHALECTENRLISIFGYSVKKNLRIKSEFLCRIEKVVFCSTKSKL